jgi:hypothetical protein
MHALPAGSWQMIAAWKFIITYTVYYKLISLLELKKKVFQIKAVLSFENVGEI